MLNHLGGFIFTMILCFKFYLSLLYFFSLPHMVTPLTPRSLPDLSHFISSSPFCNTAKLHANGKCIQGYQKWWKQNCKCSNQITYTCTHKSKQFFHSQPCSNYANLQVWCTDPSKWMQKPLFQKVPMADQDTHMMPCHCQWSHIWNRKFWILVLYMAMNQP